MKRLRNRFILSFIIVILLTVAVPIIIGSVVGTIFENSVQNDPDPAVIQIVEQLPEEDAEILFESFVRRVLAN